MDTPPPCDGRDDWFVLDNRGSGRENLAGEGEDNLSTSIRAKLTCLTRCKMRAACMKLALDAEGDEYHRWNIFGSYGAGERRRIAEDGHIPVPKMRRGANMVRVNEFIDYHLTLTEASELWGMTPRATLDALNHYIWDLRHRQGDIWVILQDAPVTSGELSQNGESVAAA